MSDDIPFDIQSEIIKRLPVKSLLQFRSVSKQWKSFIDNPKFIKNYHVNHASPQHHLLVCYEVDTVENYTSIIDDDTFPKQKFPLIAPHVGTNTKKVVIWNPTVRKFMGIDILVPKGRYTKEKCIVVGFGVCPDTSDLKLVKIIDDKISSMWVVEVFTLSTHVWKTVYTGAPFKSCDLTLFQVFLDGVIYFLVYDVFLVHGSWLNLVISFDLKSEKFGEVCLPERLVRTRGLNVTKVNESLGLLEYYKEGDMKLCGVWRFRSNGEVAMELDDDNDNESRITIYEPLSGHINDVGINGDLRTLYAWSYMETLLLLDEADSIIL
uniref:F-box domain-containing protein n=1 Tax=Tanacetum cinerariifolium TaxID=118510 RepID=A0A6L2J8Y5_TANCI|nr:hypothetical protein [Tanacetum cinerariifolium]